VQKEQPNAPLVLLDQSQIHKEQVVYSVQQVSTLLALVLSVNLATVAQYQQQLERTPAQNVLVVTKPTQRILNASHVVLEHIRTVMEIVNSAPLAVCRYHQGRALVPFVQQAMKQMKIEHCVINALLENFHKKDQVVSHVNQVISVRWEQVSAHHAPQAMEILLILLYVHRVLQDTVQVWERYADHVNPVKSQKLEENAHHALQVVETLALLTTVVRAPQEQLQKLEDRVHSVWRDQSPLKGVLVFAAHPVINLTLTNLCVLLVQLVITLEMEQTVHRVWRAL